METQSTETAIPPAAPQEAPPVVEKASRKKFPVLLVVLVLLAAGGVGAYVYLNSRPNVVPETPPESTSSVPTFAVEETVKYETLPVYPGVTVTDDAKLEGGGRRIAYETPMGTTSAQVMYFYEEELKALSWHRVIKDVDNKQLEMLAPDQTRLRVWVYFEGTGLEGEDQLPLTFIVDFGPPMGEYLPVPVQ